MIKKEKYFLFIFTLFYITPSLQAISIKERGIPEDVRENDGRLFASVKAKLCPELFFRLNPLSVLKALEIEPCTSFVMALDLFCELLFPALIPRHRADHFP